VADTDGNLSGRSPRKRNQTCFIYDCMIYFGLYLCDARLALGSGDKGGEAAQ
jgi:hypothetical protein